LKQNGFNFTNKQTFDIMTELVNSKEKMLNPILTKFIQINSILFSKSFAQFSGIASMDPNRGLIKKSLEAPDKAKPLANKGVNRGGDPNPLAPSSQVDRTTYKM
jgi:hypothetical protein